MWAGSLIWIITPGSEYVQRIARFGRDKKTPLPEPPITIGFHERTGKEPVLVHTGKFENRIYVSEWGI